MFAELRHLGGALARVPEGAGRARLVRRRVLYFAAGIVMGPEMAAAVHAAGRPCARARALRDGVGVPQLRRGADRPGARSTRDDAYARLRAIRAAVDPDGSWWPTTVWMATSDKGPAPRGGDGVIQAGPTPFGEALTARASASPGRRRACWPARGGRAAARRCARRERARRSAGRSARRGGRGRPRRSPRRPARACRAASASGAARASSRCGKPSVGMKPGITVPTWTPCGCSSARRLSLQTANAALEAEYAPAPGRPIRPAVLATLTIALGADARSSGSSASTSRTWASKLSTIVRRTRRSRSRRTRRGRRRPRC